MSRDTKNNRDTKNKKIIICLLLVLMLPGVFIALPGCWDQQEVDRLGIVMATGVDTAPGGRIRIVVQNVNPSALARGATGGGGGGVGGAGRGLTTGKSYRIRSVEGDTILEAIRDLSRESPRRLFFAHNQVLILSEELARERGVQEVLDFFERNPQIRRTTWLLVGRGDLVSLLDEPGRLEPTPAQRIAGIVDNRDRTSEYAAQRLGDFLELMESEGTQPFTAVVEPLPNPAVPEKQREFAAEGQTPEPGENITLNGTAVFRGDRLAGWLSPIESRGLLWVRGEVEGGVIQVTSAEAGGMRVSLEILRSETKLEPQIRDGQIYITVAVREESNLGETMGPLDLTRPETITRLESLQAEAIRSEIEAALAKAQQEIGVDVFGFGESVHRKYPREWKELKKMWPELFPGVQVQVQVDSKIRRTGLVSRPAEPGQR